MSEQDTRIVAEKLLDAAYARIDVLKAELAKARNDALEEAAKWHDAQVLSYTNQIAENDAYMISTGRTSAESRANEYCDDQRSTHRRSAAAIRALREEE